MIKFRLMFLSLLLIAGGCQMANRGADNNTDLDDPEIRREAYDKINSQDNQEVSARLEKAALEVPHVESANAVVLGDYVFLAIDVNDEVERSQIGTIKFSVAERLQNDPYGKRAVIVADPDIIARLKEVGADIEAGKPIQGILNELADIAGRIIPEIPGNGQSTQNTNDGKDVPAQEDNRLDREQNNEPSHQRSR
ncbi:MAG: YhcN/YlaJ family sporulation lipoprotein [Bacillus sp. (in: firmicutes)]